MAENAKALKRNDRECNGILIGPLNGPSFLPSERDSSAVCLVSVNKVGFGTNSAARMASRHLNLGKSARNGVSTTYKALSGALSTI